MDTRSGEVLSASTLLALTLSTHFNGVTTEAFEVIYYAKALSEWMLLLIGCGFFCLFAAWTESDTVRAASRFISGCIWGTVVFLLSGLDPLLPLFWMAVVLFSFDIFTVILKGQSWIQKNHF